MKALIIALISTLTLTSAMANTLVTCVVPSPRNVLNLNIDDSHLKGTLTELNGAVVSIESSDGSVFSGPDFFGIITLSPSVYAQVSSRTHAMLATQNGQKALLNCMKRTIPSPQSLSVESLIDQDQLAQCTTPRIDYGNPHRNYDAHFRACRAKAMSLNFPDNELARACIAYCMKN